MHATGTWCPSGAVLSATSEFAVISGAAELADLSLLRSSSLNTWSVLRFQAS